MKWITFRLMALTACLAASHVALAGEPWQLPRTEHGHPDMQGVWFYGTSTPFQRPVELGMQQNYSEEQARRLLGGLEQAQLQKSQALDVGRLTAPEAGVAIAQDADHNFASFRDNPTVIDGEYRTSQIISPNDGRFPYKDGGQDFFADLMDAGFGAFDGPEIRPVSERCAGPNGGPMAPMVSWFYNANMQIVQTEAHIMLLSEMNHDARIIPLNSMASDSPLSNFPQWMGRSVAHWEGDTLVVETSGFRPEQSWFAFVMSDQLQVTERFHLASMNEIVYSYTLVDPKIYLAPVTVEKTLGRRAPDEQIFEYACHEGNYSFPGILAGARRLEMVAD